MEVELILFGDN